MTIKRRIKISNNLMIIMPMLLTLLTGGILSFIIFGVAGIDPRQFASDKVTYVDSDAAMEAMSEGEYELATGEITVYKSTNGQYIIVIPDASDAALVFAIIRRYFFPLVFLAFLLAVVFFTNRALTRYVFRSIVSPIDTLVSGVHEIRDGNLSFRIKYEHDDEFAVVCSDFNEMAQRLSEMVSRQQKEETSRRELIAGISHDLRTPLTSIKAYMEGLEKGVASSPQMQEKYFDTIKSKTADLEYIINQLFMFSKLDVGEFPFHLEQIDIGHELRSFTEQQEKEYYEKGLAVSLSDIAENVTVEVDVVQFRNVIHNILENSVKYIGHDSAAVVIKCYEDGGDVKVVLTDNGPGVAEETLPKMFDLFFRNDESRNEPGKGSGLGLAISKKIIERLGGRIHAENAPGGGLAIVITLPNAPMALRG